jgi:hypothetical protein
MKLFLSHSSSDKALVREIKGQLHEFLDIWLDERQLIPGEPLMNLIEGAVSESDLVLLFISKSSIESNWVNKEIEWALKKESKLGRPFLIPIVLDGSQPPKSIASRLYFTLSSQSKSDIASLSSELNEKLFHYVVKYGIQKSPNSESNNNEKSRDGEGLNKVLGFTVDLMKSAQSDIRTKFSELIENNVELKPKTILLLCKNEVDEDLAEVERQENDRDMRANELEDQSDSESEGFGESLYALKGISNDSKIKTYKEIQRKLKFILNNEEHISNSEGVYMLKKHLITTES